MKKGDFQEFLDLAFSKPADPYKLLCAFCQLPFIRRKNEEELLHPNREGTGAVPMVRRICECEPGQKTKRELSEFAERYENLYRGFGPVGE